MKDIQIFRYEDNDVRTMEINGEPWFVLKDVCNALEIANVSKAYRKSPTTYKAGCRI